MPPARLTRYGELCGATLARAHARTGDAVTGWASTLTVKLAAA